MKTYNYLESVKEDVRSYIEENKIVVTSCSLKTVTSPWKCRVQKN